MGEYKFCNTKGVVDCFDLFENSRRTFESVFSAPESLGATVGASKGTASTNIDREEYIGNIFGVFREIRINEIDFWDAV